MSGEPRLVRTPDQIVVEDSTWLTLGQLRDLVRMADEANWDDRSLVSHGAGSQHIRRHDVRIARKLVVEGNDPTGP